MRRLYILVVLALLPVLLYGQQPGGDNFQFTKEVRHEATPVKFQGLSGTCWVYGTLSLVEAELLRMGKGRHDLSEMFVVRHNYADRTVDYVRYHGHKKYSGGAEGWDVFRAIKRYGIVPEKAYPVRNPDAYYADHTEMDAVLKGIADTIATLNAPKLSNVWHKAFTAVLDTYMGELPDTFTYGRQEFTPASYAQHLGADPNDYVAIGSYTHHPYYEKFIFEGADNWSQGSIYNVPLNELIYIMHHAIDSGYTFSWVSDVSNKGFDHQQGIAIFPDTDLSDQEGQLRAAWGELGKEKRSMTMYSLVRPVPEVKVTPKLRQEAFDNHTTTEDHMMHITGRAYDQHGKPYFIVKNSWGRGNPYNGYIYASQPFVKMYTLSIALHKNAIPQKIKAQLAID